ncbi:diguanylate cyclase domain-containing protein [Kangiella koreensis]|uniref:Putative periplasmic ligand-binding sensor protein n=1 Tax=Kangiella koreensis (strain DSM 16069 / JCM 12317 / KCTC 12182 / SW-125) TaxID=523791 RepID=C7RC47_KANKD|nr:diguanylate cyclase [Kangiella koreensis]ACV26839.1 putative periplasmic ligand-binding sensor protein [Kangiella koreensis DSM 16069]
MKKKVINLAVILACFFYLVITTILFEFFLKSYEEDINREARQHLTEEFLLVRANVESALYSDVFIANGLVTVLSVNKELALDNFDAFAKTLIQNGRYIRNIGISEGYVISKVYPFKGNEKAIDFDFRSKPEQFKTVENARLTKSVVMAGPLELVQGGQAIIARFPVFDDVPLNSNYWGGVSIVIDVEKLFEDAGLYRLLNKFDVAIRGLNGTGGEGPFFIGNKKVFDEADITSVIEIPGGSWVMTGSMMKAPSNTFLNSLIIYRVMGYGLIVLILLLVMLLYRSYHLAHRASMLDELTGLRNRRFAFILLEKLTEDQKKKPFAVISIDLNGFKDINDNFGHQAGDYVLTEVANIILDNVRQTDICCRLGGDEFLILLPRVYKKNEVESVIHKLKKAVNERSFKFEQHNLNLSLSAGYGLFPYDTDDMEELVHKADLMMYEDKKESKKL